MSNGGNLYDADIVEWSERQGALLRRIAAGERVNNADLDWPNIAEEVESVGRSELSAVEALLFQSLVHDLKAEAWPLSREVAHWRAEARGFRAQASLRFSPSMRQKIDVARLTLRHSACCPTRWRASRRRRCRRYAR